MSNITIEKGIPIPAKGSIKYPWAEMEVGDSFFTPTKRGSVTASAANASKTGKNFQLRNVTENGIAGTRVWRVK